MLMSARLLRHRQIRGSKACAIATANLLLRVVAIERWNYAHEMIAQVRRVGNRLINAQPRELAVGNIVRRVLGIIREEAEENEKEEREKEERAKGGPVKAVAAQPPIAAGMFQILASPVSPLKERPTPSAPAIRRVIIDEIRGLITEIQKVDDDIAVFASEHIHSNEIILTSGYSSTVQKFLIRAASVGKGPFTVIITEGYPNDHNKVHEVLAGVPPKDAKEAAVATEPSPVQFQRALTNAGITVIMIPDSAVFAMMSRVNKVILGTHAVTANGGLVAQAGTSAIAKAAKEHRTPVVIVSGVYKLSPVHPNDFEGIAEAGNPAATVAWEDGQFPSASGISSTDIFGAKFLETVDTINILYDYVPPELVDLYITNLQVFFPQFHYTANSFTVAAMPQAISIGL